MNSSRDSALVSLQNGSMNELKAYIESKPGDLGILEVVCQGIINRYPLEGIKFLIDKVVSPNYFNWIFEKYTLLHWAVFANSYDVAICLLKKNRLYVE